MKPIEHAKSSSRIWGGSYKDYLEIHELLDSSKSAFGDVRHRAITHNSWFISTILERIFGTIIVNSDNVEVSVRDIGEQHVTEDFRGKFIPTVQDYLQEMELTDWMDNGKALPPSRKKVKENQETRPLSPPLSNKGINTEFADLIEELNKKQIEQERTFPKRHGNGLLD